MADDTPDPMRTQVLDAIAARLASMQKGQPDDDPYLLAFSEVSRNPLGRLPAGKKAMAGVFGGTGSRSYVSGYQVVKLPVTLEISLNQTKGQDSSRNIELALSEVERLINTDIQFGGLIVNTQVTGDQANIDGPYPDQVDGALFLDVTYFQGATDPRLGRS